MRSQSQTIPGSETTLVSYEADEPCDGRDHDTIELIINDSPSKSVSMSLWFVTDSVSSLCHYLRKSRCELCAVVTVIRISSEDRVFPTAIVAVIYAKVAWSKRWPSHTIEESVPRRAQCARWNINSPHNTLGNGAETAPCSVGIISNAVVCPGTNT